MEEKQKENIGTLFIIATPIGNLEDMTFRAVRILTEVDYVIAEDTRKTKVLLDRYSLTTLLKSYHSHTSSNKKLDILNDLVSGRSIALVTDAGTPGISDPGNELISFLLDHDPRIQIIPIPGASALTAIISVSGFDMSKFTFVGFLPKKKSNKLLNGLMVNRLPFVFYESPYRIEKTLMTIKSVWDSSNIPIQVVIGRELTKKFEEVLRGSLDEVLQQVQSTDRRGEYVVIVAPQPQKINGLADKS